MKLRKANGLFLCIATMTFAIMAVLDTKNPLVSLVVNASNLGHVMNTFPSKVNYQYGSTYLMNFSLLLPGAGTDFAMWLKDQVGISFAGGGRTSTILGEAYLNFGFAFMYIQMLLMGVLGKIISNYSVRNNYSFLAVYLIWQFAHSASGGIANVILLVFIYFFVYFFITMFPIIRYSTSKYANARMGV